MAGDERGKGGGRSRRIRRRERGMTLAEVIIASTISVFIMIVFMSLLSSSRASWLVSQVQSDLYLSGRKAMQDMFRELVESQTGRCDSFLFLDSASGRWCEGLWFASGRGDPGVAGEDGSSTNDYVHLNSGYVISWRSLVVICPYMTDDGNVQLRRYVDYGSSTNYYSGGTGADIFPLTLYSVTPAMIRFQQYDGTIISFDRTGGTVLANYLGSEDTNNNNVLDTNENDGDATLPLDNADGVLNRGINLTKGNGYVDVTLFLSREVAAMQQAGRTLITTIKSKIKFRQPS